MKNIGYNEERSMILEISKIAFAITEMTLYLDTHPYDLDAIEQCERYLNKKKQLEKEYYSKYAPLCVDDAAGNHKEWSWALQPAPWERGY